jgi:hypothetical protein
LHTHAMKIAALYCVHGEERWLPFSMRGAYDAVDSVHFLISSRRWYGPPGDNRPLLDAIRALPDPLRKIRILEGEWSEETVQRNFSLAAAQLDGSDYGLIIDADEIYDRRQLRAMLDFAVSYPEVECWHVRWFTYWKSLRFRIDPIEPYDPPALVKLGTCGFYETRNPVAAKHALIPPELGLCHHLSYVRSDEELRRKHIFFPGQPQSMQPNWFENVWQAWDRDHDLRNLHPVNPPQFQRAVPQPLELVPEVLREEYLSESRA